MEQAPTEPGFYVYSGGAQSMVFLLGQGGVWHVISDSGEMTACGWEYIEQALGVWDLVRLDSIVPEVVL